ncbi:capsule assembly Wzi family protein [Terriglobus albidus]|uniref:capsule assembly Wzi family protein n=1 Tax=Terriglobus albidus TaxID=1592106 RepID=UPI0021DF4A80|nr:capsule assembly Wzi family protein [Terriglobus albidus]
MKTSLEEDTDAIKNASDDEVVSLYTAVMDGVQVGATYDKKISQTAAGSIDSLYVRGQQIAGPPLVQDFYYGETIVNDYGRPIGRGFQGILGASTHGQLGILFINFRGEYQHLPGQGSLSDSVANYERTINMLPTLPKIRNSSDDRFVILNASVSVILKNSHIGVGKFDRWWGPGTGGAMLWSNNAEPIYEFRIKRDSPLRIPILSSVLGPVQWDLFLGDLKGHTTPNKPWVQGQKFTFHPTKRLEVGFARTVVFGGKGNGGLTFHSFWKAFASIDDQIRSGKTQFDPGDRRAAFDFRYAFPHITAYADGFSDDDPLPLANLKRSAWRPGLYVPVLPYAKQFDFRFEAPYTNMAENQTYPTPGMNYRNLNYRDGYTNKQRLLGDWIGPDSTGYQAWLGFWKNPRDKVTLDWRMSKLDTAYFPGGGTQHTWGMSLAKVSNASHGVLDVRLQVEQYKIPAITADTKRNVALSLQWTQKNIGGQ